MACAASPAAAAAGEVRLLLPLQQLELLQKLLGGDALQRQPEDGAPRLGRLPRHLPDIFSSLTFLV